ncbi:MAG: hypothetical protein EZS28_016602 [Streblomastix strix]|uniref:Uncharacterized protein n=1 Tax=Streblomastix strix TaxID=222440 RepID=A0A5J4VYW5_9EUKA|nr:MAG: hypothetical protein EZS28_016602 [Streblomastix strix]
MEKDENVELSEELRKKEIELLNGQTDNEVILQNVSFKRKPKSSTYVSENVLGTVKQTHRQVFFPHTPAVVVLDEEERQLGNKPNIQPFHSSNDLHKKHRDIRPATPHPHTQNKDQLQELLAQGQNEQIEFHDLQDNQQNINNSFGIDPLNILLTAKNLKQIKYSLVEIEKLTNGNEAWCIKVGRSGAIFILFKLLVSCGLSEIHKVLIRIALCIIEHLGRYTESSSIIWSIHEVRKAKYGKDQQNKLLIQLQNKEKRKEKERIIAKQGKQIVRKIVLNDLVEFVCNMNEENQSPIQSYSEDEYEEIEDEGSTFCNLFNELLFRVSEDDALSRVTIVVILRLLEGEFERIAIARRFGFIRSISAVQNSLATKRMKQPEDQNNELSSKANAQHRSLESMLDRLKVLMGIA